MYLQQFDFHAECQARKHHTNADALSWIPSPDTVISESQSLLGNSSIVVHSSINITAMSNNNPPPHNIAACSVS